MMMLSMEGVLSELSDYEKRNEQGLPPGFRFHPTDEELLTFYLASKVFNGTFTTHLNFAEVDLNRCEPWELPEVAKMGEREWYLLSMRDRKYPTGLRTNRATGAGYWKATGKDKEVYNASSGALLGMKKTLVFYTGRAPRGEKTKWVMHEYRLDAHFSIHSHPPNTFNSKEEWVICRIFHKSGEKKTHVLQIQGNLDASSKSSLPPFHTTPPFFTQFQNDLSNSNLFPFHPFAPTNAITNNTNHDALNSCTLKVIKEHINLPKSTKTEDTFYPYQLLHDTNMLSNTNSSNFQSSLPLNMNDSGLMMGFSGAEDAELRDMMMSTSIPFNKQSLQQIMLDSPIAIDSWPLPQHV
ncbi:hypothetical protein TanjilG_05391 [Lupinus angustifolius]|uniref:NAC domain-containing protein n=1 Tax=Lupinus angustifolius TaxID=3871 RepID=A0A1J7I828_LUPAN|nr:PREDICTED: protein CUP-SHAPED COTYLEDON 3 [Lupinus angustifolius]OIW14770.1 hypothetical protein TanjilG_05391 [Lupinus angustifolius]